MAKDLEELGYVMEHALVDTQNYLLRQRRNRVYATADVSNGQSAAPYGEKMEETMQALGSSDALISFEQIFDMSLPKKPLSSDRQHQKLQQALEAACLKAQSNNIFIDNSTSNSRMAEYAVDVLTCVRPTHAIYSQKLARFVTVKEMWACQGLFESSFENPSAVHDMLARPAEAQDLAGNAFSSTCMQAKLMASMIHSHGWEGIQAEPNCEHSALAESSGEMISDQCSYPMSSPTPRKCSHISVDSSGADELADSKPTGLKRKASSMSDRTVVPLAIEQNDPIVPVDLPVKRRVYGKTKAIVAAQPVHVVASSNLPADDAKLSESEVNQQLASLEHLRLGNSRKKRGRPDQQALALEPRQKKRKYVPRGKIAREGKRSCISIWAKMQLFQVSSN